MSLSKVPVNMLGAPSAIGNGANLTHNGSSFTWSQGAYSPPPPPPVALMVGTVYGYTLFGEVSPASVPSLANTYNDPSGTYPIKLVSKYPFATETDARVVNYNNPSGNTIKGVVGIAGDTKVYALGFSGAQNSPYFDKGGWSVGVGLASGSVDNSYLDPQGGVYGGATSSSSSGYVYGGYFYNNGPFPQPSGYVDTIFKFPFAGSIGKTDVGELEAGLTGIVSTGTDDTGFLLMGHNASSFSPPYAPGRTMRSMTYSSDTLATLPYTMNAIGINAKGISSQTHGYAIGGTPASPPFSPIRDYIQRFPFVADSGTTQVAELVAVATASMTLSSTEKGYVNGGRTSPSYSSNIDDQYSFPFSSETSIASTGSIIISNRFNYGKWDGAGAGTQA